MHTKKVMIVEDEAITALFLERNISKLGYAVCHVTDTGEDAVSFAQNNPIDCVIMDIRLKGPMDGIDAGASINHSIPIIYYSAFVDKETMNRLRAQPHHAILEKPASFEDIAQTIAEAVH
ncbi:response regulator [Oceanidesulfovibrio marinus]|uniref:Response regulator n=1 Tax=Oceanidesulfovibrio marinus TaxID=370038 RepID=A0A6P1ZJ19_9BACT|nr:response regulator [Oceanidesulfovibrio marinus]QJT08081.1 response regulator [Oceanidesulfovibrio marinus]TVM34981.1 response regulator [Oceanidesulfovibrio marinus]